MNAIEVRNLSKKFTHYPSQRDRFIDMATGGRAKRGTDFWALKDISFDVPKGTTFGIIGQNGSGKSTLLSILAGVLQPTSGTFKVNGKVAAILELGSGFHHEFTGRENVYMYGAILGLSRLEIDRRLDEIIDFSELQEFIDRPLYTYSSGMVARLSFAVVINVDADILIVDEALAVGDMFFQAKCMLRMKSIADAGITLLFVSHDVSAVKSLCAVCMLLEGGKAIECSNSEKVIQNYALKNVEREQNVITDMVIPVESGKLLDDNFDRIILNELKFQELASFQRIQNGKARFKNVQLLDEYSNEISNIHYEQKVILRMTLEILEDIPTLVFGYLIRDKNGIDVVYSDSHIESKNLYSVKVGERYVLDWGFVASLKHGSYHVSCVASIPISMEIGKVVFCDYIPLAVSFVTAARRGSDLCGLIHWNNSLVITKCSK